MKTTNGRALCVLALMALAGVALADTTYVETPGVGVDCKRGSTLIGTDLVDKEACLTLARADAEARKANANYFSQPNKTKFAVKYVAPPPGPVDATCRDNGWADVGPPVPAICPATGQQTQAQIHTWTTLTPAANGGKDCPAAVTQTITKSCMPPMNMGPPVDPSKIMVPAVGYTTSRGTVPVNPPAAADGAFRPQMFASHMNKDDSILYPGMVGGAPHWHEYAGNLGSNANSTIASLMACTATTDASDGIDNCSTYWWPPPVKPDGTPVMASKVMMYYKSGNYTQQNGPDATIQDFPAGFSMIAGALTTNTVERPPYASHFTFSCVNRQTSTGDADWGHIPKCAEGTDLVVSLQFPDCSNGLLTSANGRDHVAYASGGVCPAAFPVQLAALTYNIHYPVEAGDDTSLWYLTSDMYYGQRDANGVLLPGGLTMHADYRAAWKPAKLQALMDACVRSTHDCG